EPAAGTKVGSGLEIPALHAHAGFVEVDAHPLLRLGGIQIAVYGNDWTEGGRENRQTEAGGGDAGAQQRCESNRADEGGQLPQAKHEEEAGGGYGGKQEARVR